MPSDLWWLEQTDADLPSEDDWLADREAARLRELKYPKRRNEWRLGRWTAKQAVASYLRLPPSPLQLRQIEIHPAPSGAPEALLDDRPAALAISLSHCRGFALCAVAPPEIELGCDVELVEPHEAGLVNDYFTAGEQASIATQPDEEARILAVVLVWSAKESAMKAVKEGLRISTHDMVVNFDGSLATTAVWQPLRVEYSAGRVFAGWWLSSSGVLRTIVAGRPCAAPAQLQTQSPL